MVCFHSHLCIYSVYNNNNNNNNNNTSILIIAPIFPKRRGFSGAPSTGVGLYAIS